MITPGKSNCFCTSTSWKVWQLENNISVGCFFFMNFSCNQYKFLGYNYFNLCAKFNEYMHFRIKRGNANASNVSNIILYILYKFKYTSTFVMKRKKVIRCSINVLVTTYCINVYHEHNKCGLYYFVSKLITIVKYISLHR